MTENFGDGPDIAIAVTATTDNSFTFTLTPATGTQFYNFIVDENPEPEELDNTMLLKGSYGNAGNLQNAATDATVTLTVSAEPNTTYQIYAVAANDKGIVGAVAVASVTTTDGEAPALDSDPFEQQPAAKAVDVWFDQDLIRGEGAVTAVYYKEWDWENPVAVPADEIVVTVNGPKATFAAPTTPDGAIVLFSWTQGAFVDAKGNQCGAFTTTYDEDSDAFVGAYVENKKVAFEIDDDITPESGSLFSDWKTFKAAVNFDFDLFRLPTDIESDGLAVAYYTNSDRKAVYRLKKGQWFVEGQTLYFTLPAEPMPGDVVSFGISASSFFDVYGNPNKQKDFEANWTYFEPTKEGVLGTFEVIYTYEYNNAIESESLGNIVIEENATDEESTGIIVKDFYLEESELEGYYDLTNGKVYIYEGQILGHYTDSKGTTYGLVLYNYDNETEDFMPIPFTMHADGTMTADVSWGVLAFDEEFTTPLAWFDVSIDTTFKPVAASARKVVGIVSGKGFANKSLKAISQKSVKRIRK